MGLNFDDYPGFQQTPGILILLQHSVHATNHNFDTYRDSNTKSSIFDSYMLKLMFSQEAVCG